MKFRKQYLTLTELGRVFGVGQKLVGKWLEDVGLRTNKGRPSFTAYHERLADAVGAKELEDRFVWQGERTVAALIENGWKPVVPPPTDLVPTPLLAGPFKIRLNAGCPHEIVGATGEVAIWVSGDVNAQIVCLLLNAGHRLGVIGRMQPEVKQEPEPAEEPAPTRTDGFVIYGVR